MPVTAHGIGITVAIFVGGLCMLGVITGCFTTINVVIARFPIPSIVIGWFVLLGVISDPFPVRRIVVDSFVLLRIDVCCCGRCWLNVSLRKSTRRRRLRFRSLLRSRLTGRCLLCV